jgi:hypothetical protein
MTRARRALRLGAALALLAGRVSAVSPAEARGDAAWARRADGFAESGRVAPGPAADAVSAYEEAFAAEGPQPRLAGKLVDALWFRGHFALADGAGARALYDRAVEVAETAVARAVAMKDETGEAEARFWAAIAWGVWGMEHGYFASGLKGVAGRIRDHAERAAALDETLAAGGPRRVLGRLHTATPKLPLFTGWIDPAKGITALERAVAISTADPRNELFLAEALLEHAPARRTEALDLLARVAGRTPDPAELVEQSETIAAARRRFATEQGNPEKP